MPTLTPSAVPQVFANRDAENGDFVAQIVEADRNRFIRLVGDGTDVAVLLPAFPAQQFDCNLGEFLWSMVEVRKDHFGAGEKTAIVVVNTKDEELALVSIPVTADAAEAAGAVVERLVHDADLGFGDGPDGSLEIGVLGHGCGPRRDGCAYDGIRLWPRSGNGDVDAPLPLAGRC